MDCDKNHSEFRVNVISLLTVYVKREICEWKFPLFFVILSEKLANSVWFHAKSLKLQELDENKISQFRTEVKCDSVKF